MNLSILPGLLAAYLPLNTMVTSLKIGSPPPPLIVTRAQWIMGTVCEITAYGPDASLAITAAFDEISRLDRVMSLYKEDSELSRLNRLAGQSPYVCSQSLWEAISAAKKYWRLSGGAFDPTILKPEIGFQKVILDTSRRTVFFSRPAMGLDLGGIGKGIALDHAVKTLKARGIKSALLNFGGQIYALGAPPNATAWSVATSKATLLVKNASVSTSGNDERPGHILSPVAGKPIMRTDSVTVVAPNATEADAWSTALFVLGFNVPKDFHGCAIYSGLDPDQDPKCAPYRGDTP